MVICFSIFPINVNLTESLLGNRRGKGKFVLSWMKYIIFPSVQDRGLHKRQPLVGQKVTRASWLFTLISWPIYCQQVEALSSRQIEKLNITPRFL